jgi:hypothetical protein
VNHIFRVNKTLKGESASIKRLLWTEKQVEGGEEHSHSAFPNVPRLSKYSRSISLF